MSVLTGSESLALKGLVPPKSKDKAPTPKKAWGDIDMSSQSEEDELAQIWTSLGNVSLETQVQKVSISEEKKVFRVPSSIRSASPEGFPEGLMLCKIVAAFFAVPIDFKTEIPQSWDFVTDDLRQRVAQIAKFLLAVRNGKWKESHTGVFARKYDQIALALLAIDAGTTSVKQAVNIHAEMHDWLSLNISGPSNSWWSGMAGHIVNSVKHYFTDKDRRMAFLEAYDQRNLPGLGKKSLSKMKVQFFEERSLQDPVMVNMIQQHWAASLSTLAMTLRIDEIAYRPYSVFSPERYKVYLSDLAKGAPFWAFLYILCAHNSFKLLGKDKNGALIRRMAHFREGGTPEGLPEGLSEKSILALSGGKYRDLARQLGKMPQADRKRKRTRSQIAPVPPEGLSSSADQQTVVRHIYTLLEKDESVKEKVSAGQITAWLSNENHTQLKAKNGNVFEPPSKVKTIKEWWKLHRRALPEKRVIKSDKLLTSEPLRPP